MLISWLHIAFAAAPANGDFEAGDTDWFDVSPSTATVQRVAEGQSFGDTLDTTSLVFPSTSHAMLLKNGEFAEFTPAIVSSATFVVTHRTLSVQHFDEVAGLITKSRFDPDIGIAVEIDTLPESPGAFATATSDLTPWCGLEGRVQFAQNGTTVSATHFTLLDDVTVVDLCEAYVDGDGDGYCRLGVDSNGDGTCIDPGEFLIEGQLGGDCDDTDVDQSPEGIEIANDGIDQDCSGADFEPNCFADGDGDGFGGEAIEGSLGCSDPGESSNPDDCDDTVASINPAAVELCNGIDDNCDEVSDPVASFDVWPDEDEDGFGDDGAVAVAQCGTTFEGALNNEDCNDGNPFVSPAATEAPGDALDQDCDGFERCFTDADGDGVGDLPTPGPLDCAGAAVGSGDCDDIDPDVFPGASESCNNLDDDCDGMTDEGFSAVVYYPDADGDGFGDEASPLSACDDPGAGFLTNGDDCDDTSAAINPDAAEIRADGEDQDCDGFEACYADVDGDGFGALAVAFDPTLTCDGAGFSSDPNDCNDNDAAVNPAAMEVVDNTVDEDCDGIADQVVSPPIEVLYKGGACSQVGGGTVVGWLAMVGLAARRRR